jgi:hypothetical protein
VHVIESIARLHHEDDIAFSQSSHKNPHPSSVHRWDADTGFFEMPPLSQLSYEGGVEWVMRRPRKEEPEMEHKRSLIAATTLGGNEPGRWTGGVGSRREERRGPRPATWAVEEGNLRRLWMSNGMMFWQGWGRGEGHEYRGDSWERLRLAACNEGGGKKEEDVKRIQEGGDLEGGVAIVGIDEPKPREEVQGGGGGVLTQHNPKSQQ